MAGEGQPPIDGPWTISQTTTCPPSFISIADLECAQDLADHTSPYDTECTWSAVTSPATSQYQLQTRRRNGDGTWTRPNLVAPTAARVVRKLVVGTYQARVQAYQPREGGWSDWTQPFEIVVPVPVAAPVGNCTASTSGLVSTITWTWSSAGTRDEYDITYTDPAEHPIGLSLWQDAGSRTAEGPVTMLTPGARYTVYVRAKNGPGISAHTEIGCAAPAPNGASQYAEVQKIAKLGDIEGGYTLQQFKNEKTPPDPTNPTTAPYPYLNWVDDDCSIPREDTIQGLTGWGNEYDPIVPGLPSAPLKEGCWRHDFAWRNLYRIEQKYSVDSWNQTTYSLSNNRLLADWHDICRATYYSGGASFFGFTVPIWLGFGLDCQVKSTTGWVLLVAATSVDSYSSNIEEVGYVQQ